MLGLATPGSFLQAYATVQIHLRPAAIRQQLDTSVLCRRRLGRSSRRRFLQMNISGGRQFLSFAFIPKGHFKFIRLELCARLRARCG